MFLRKPREKPFLSEPVLNTGALNASKTETTRKRETQRESKREGKREYGN